MSDTSQGEGWWQASDGKWYPPESRSGAAMPGVENTAGGNQASPGEDFLDMPPPEPNAQPRDLPPPKSTAKPGDSSWPHEVLMGRGDTRTLVVHYHPPQPTYELFEADTRVAEITRGSITLRGRESYRVRRGFRRLRVVGRDGDVLVEATRRKRGRYEVSTRHWNTETHLVLTKERADSGEDRRAELRGHGEILVAVEVSYRHKVKNHRHEASVYGSLTHAAEVPIEVVSVCTLLALRGWARTTPEVGRWTSEPTRTPFGPG